jgi:UDP-GlcNAc:undecaprenyl-phosphate GlcNAc-1-phosphate transferase
MVCLIFSMAAMRWIAPLGWMDFPRGRRQHGRPTPRTGGLALLGALALGQVLGMVRLPLRWHEWAMVYAVGLMGVLDDRFDLRARWKALASLIAGAALAWLSWDVLRLAGSHLPLFDGYLATRTGLALVLLWAWYWSIPQACNLIDGMNGLALGFFLALALSMDLPFGGPGRGAYLLGAIFTLGLLNWPGGRQFLGDSGSLTLGTLFALLGVHLVAVVSPNHLLWAFAYPIMDVLMVMAIRLANGQPLGEGDRNHYHHQWQRLLPAWPNLALALTLLPAIACMQVLQNYPWHRTIAWAGLAWLAACAAWFIRRSTGAQDAFIPARSEAAVGEMEG